MFCAGNLPRCFTLLTPDFSIIIFLKYKVLVGAVNWKQFNIIKPMLFLEFLAPINLSGLFELIAERLRKLWFLRFEQHPFARSSLLFSPRWYRSCKLRKNLISINYFGWSFRLICLSCSQLWHFPFLWKKNNIDVFLSFFPCSLSFWSVFFYIKVMLLRLWHDVLYPATRGERIHRKYSLISSIFKGAGEANNEKTHFIFTVFDVWMVENINMRNILALLKPFCHCWTQKWCSCISIFSFY